jgi:dTDP-4-amino-4,6-dideoxygalactose transaminase
MINGLFPPWPSFTDEEVDAVSRVLRSNKVSYWTGQEGRQFEREFAEFSGSAHAIAVANGTVALDLALISLGVGVGDEVIVTSRTFLASVSSIVNVGAIPIFADVDLDSQNITAESISHAHVLLFAFTLQAGPVIWIQL